MTFVLCVWLMAFGDKPLLARVGQNDLVVKLPSSMLDDAATRRRLLSGLTLSLELESRLDGAQGIRDEHCLVTVRYDVWEEKILINELGPGGTVNAHVFPSLDAFFAWLKNDGLRCATVAPADFPLRLRINCRIIPYSAEEAKITRDWFAQRLEVARAGDRGLVGGEGTTTAAGNTMFEVLMSGGIRERPIQSHSWKWLIPAGGLK